MRNLIEQRQVAEDDEQRRLRASPMSDDHRLTNVHKIIPSSKMQEVPYSGKSKVTVYRGVAKDDPNPEIRPGDWVALKQSYAKKYGGGKVIKKVVPAKDVSWAGTDMDEWFYTPSRRG